MPWLISIHDYDNMDNDLTEFLPDIEKHIPVYYKPDTQKSPWKIIKERNDLGDPFLEEEEMERMFQ